MAVNPSSIVDFLKKRGFQSGANEQFPLFDFRKNLYSQAGLIPEKGSEFRGSATENQNLLNLLTKAEQARGVSISPSNISDFISSARGSSVAPPVVPTAEPTPTTASSIVGQQYTPPNQLTPEEIAQKALEDVTGSMTFPFQQEEVEAEKADIALKAQAEKEKLINSLASRGLIFSGKKTTGLEAIDADAIARTLGVDRKFALLIAGGLEQSAQRIAKEAQQGNKDALTSLRALGYDVNPLTGQIEPTLAAQKAIASEERAIINDERAASREERAIAAEQRSAAAAARAEARFADFERRAEGIYTPKEQQEASTYMDIAHQEGAKFDPSTVPEKYRSFVVTNLFAEQRAATTPRAWSADELTSAFANIKASGGDYNVALKEIDSDPLITNKDQAKAEAAKWFSFNAPTAPKTKSLFKALIGQY